MTGLLHDIGQLTLYCQRPKQSAEALLLCINRYDGRDHFLAEQEVFGFSHEEVGMELARAWEFPELFQQCFAHHHSVDKADSYAKEVELLHAANVFAVLMELDSDDLLDGPPLSGFVSEYVANDPEKIAEIRNSIEKVYFKNRVQLLDMVD